jgi:MoxR-like ATPase
VCRDTAVLGWLTVVSPPVINSCLAGWATAWSGWPLLAGLRRARALELVETTSSRNLLMSKSALSSSEVARVAHFVDIAAAGIEQVLCGKRSAIRLALSCLLAGGHLLIEDVPGTGKTSLARALAAVISGTSHRIQFTPDLLPTDITGVSIWDKHTEGFEFHHGPIFANVVVADEINRASPKTQSALLEVMEEAHVTVDGIRHPVPEPFMVVATQNPIDLEGTYRLPEAQLDRFLMRLSLGHPDVAVEEHILLSRAAEPIPALRQVATLEYIRQLQQVVTSVHVAPEIAGYIARLAQATRVHPALRLGMSTRGSLAILRAAQACGASHGRHYIVPDDVRAVIPSVVTHRLILSVQAEVHGTDAATVLDEVLASVALPSLAALAR